MTRLPLTISIRFVSPLPGSVCGEINRCLVKVFWNESDYWQLAPVLGVLGVMWRKRKNYFDKWLKTNLWTVNFYFIDPQNYLHIMRTFLNRIKNETLDEIKTSLENFWQRMIQLSEFFQYSFVLILKWKCLVGGSRVRCRESGTPSTIIYTQWSSRRYELGCDAPVVHINNSLFLWLVGVGVAVNAWNWYEIHNQTVLSYSFVKCLHCSNTIMSVRASQITCILIVCSTVFLGFFEAQIKESIKVLHSWPLRG